ncbi:MAG: S-adenosylmethionine decarboxylase [Burkholderiaceae bacterium]
MHGLHLTADLRDCLAAQPLMTEPELLRRLCLAAVHEAGLQTVGELFHRFAPAAQQARSADAAPPGITGVVLLAQSHLAVHTWPELGAVTIDVFVCNVQGDHSRSAHLALERLVDAFGAATVSRQILYRGGPDRPPQRSARIAR